MIHVYVDCCVNHISSHCSVSTMLHSCPPLRTVQYSVSQRLEQSLLSTAQVAACSCKAFLVCRLYRVGL